MIIWDDAQTQCQNLSSDSTSGSLTFFKFMMNIGYKYVLAALNRPVTEKTYSITTVASQQYYYLPPEALFVKTVTFTSGSRTQTMVEEESQENWDRINEVSQTSTFPSLFFIRPNFGLSNNQIGFYPKPSTAITDAITVIAEITDRDLATAKYTTGTIAVTNASTTITGTGSTFTAAMVGRYFNITDADGDGMFYRIATYTSATVLVLDRAYNGSTDTSANYQIVEMFNLPEEIQILPCYFALAQYFASKGNKTETSLYWTLYNTGLELAQQRWATKTRSSVIRAQKLSTSFARWAPGFFPSSGIS